MKPCTPLDSDTDNILSVFNIFPDWEIVMFPLSSISASKTGVLFFCNCTCVKNLSNWVIVSGLLSIPKSIFSTV